MSPSELGDRLIVTRATMTGVVDSLERRGFARRSPHPSDRRSVIVEITPAGRDVVQQVRTLIHANEKDWMRGLSESELRGYIDVLHRIQDSVANSTERTPDDGAPE